MLMKLSNVNSIRVKYLEILMNALSVEKKVLKIRNRML